jgi:ATP-dependent 26S proteasome regulatory subunit
MMTNKRLVTATFAKANEGAPCCIFVVDELYNVMGWKLLRHDNRAGEARCTVVLQLNP